MIRIANQTEIATEASETPVMEERERERAALRNGFDSEQTLQLIGAAADEQKAQDIVVLDVRGQTIVADFFVMCTGTSTTHIHSIADGVQERLREQGLRAKPEGNSESFWVILDYGDVILHIFDEGTREFYDLEKLWADAKVSPWPVSGENNSSQDVQTEETGNEDA